MNEKQREKVLKRTPFLKGRSDKSIEKTADSFLDLSNKLFSVIFLSVISVPLFQLIKNMFAAPTVVSFELEQLKSYLNVNGVVFLVVIFIAVVWAWHFRKIALDLYDVLNDS
jgi:hypothetical protein